MPVTDDQAQLGSRLGSSGNYIDLVETYTVKKCTHPKCKTCPKLITDKNIYFSRMSLVVNITPLTIQKLT